MLNLVITCGDHYPDVPPEVKFVSKISMNCVDKNGRVRLICLFNRGQPLMIMAGGGGLGQIKN